MADTTRDPSIGLAKTLKRYYPFSLCCFDEEAYIYNSLLDSSDYSDLTITCGNGVYKVHKNIVCTSSEFFGRAERFPGGEVRVAATICRFYFADSITGSNSTHDRSA